MSDSTPSVRDHLVRASAEVKSGFGTSFYRAARRGEFLRLAEGVFIPTSSWEALSPEDQFLARIHAVNQAFGGGLVFSHLSAAALWRRPNVRVWPEKPEVVVGRGVVGASRQALSVRRYEVPEPDTVEGLLVTPLARTMVDVARSQPLEVAVAMIDHALSDLKDDDVFPASARTTRELLRQADSGIASNRGRLRFQAAAALADGNSGSPGESLSRTGMHLLGLPAPKLQHSFHDAAGLIGIVDFWWPEFGLVGEFDGLGKYLREDYLHGRTTAQAVIDEKIREDRLRALGLRVTRWGWSTASSLPALDRHLRRAGLR